MTAFGPESLSGRIGILVVHLLQRGIVLFFVLIERGGRRYFLGNDSRLRFEEGSVLDSVGGVQFREDSFGGVGVERSGRESCSFGRVQSSESSGDFRYWYDMASVSLDELSQNTVVISK